MSPVISGPRCNRRVTCDASPSNARSESAIAANPNDPYNLVGASKRFTNPQTYSFSLAAYATFDGGQSWTEAPPFALLPGWAGTSDPAVAWDHLGNAYVVALPFGPGTSLPTLGIAVYKSSDGGRTWGPPTLIHSSGGDDKQWAAGDASPISPHRGNIYAAWDNGSQLAFARSSDQGATWRGVGTQPVGTALAFDSFSPELSVAADGTVYIVWLAGTQLKLVKSTDGGDSFSAPAVAVNGITLLGSGLPVTQGWAHFPGGTFRVLTLPTGCCAKMQNVILAWADLRDGVSHIYYRRSTDGGATWLGPAAGQALLTGAVVSGANQQDFHPQLISTPAGEIGCAFYEFGPKTAGGPNLIDVILAVSTDDGATFPNRVTVTDQAWDPTVDAPIVHGTTMVTFIGEYFGLDASRLGFFPFWTDTRTGVQEMFTSRHPVNPTDLYIRDYTGDVGNVTATANWNSWEAPDLIVRRQADGDITFVNEDLLRDGVTDHYVYARATNNGPNLARNVRVAVTVGNYPSLDALPGTEFRYPLDWYQKDWFTSAEQARHLFLGESVPTTVSAGASKIVGPIVWPAAQIPDPAAWHPCLLAEVRADNEDSAGGVNGCPIPASGDSNSCNFGSYFWGDNSICQRNLSYGTVVAAEALLIELPFLVGSSWSSAKYLELIIDKGPALARVPMRLHTDPMSLPRGNGRPDYSGRTDLVFVDGGRIAVRVDASDVGEIVAAPGTSWRTTSTGVERTPSQETCFGGKPEGRGWKLLERTCSVGFPVARGEMRRATLSFRTPRSLEPGTTTHLRIAQRNDRRIITGFVTLQLTCVPAPVRHVKRDAGVVAEGNLHTSRREPALAAGREGKGRHAKNR